MDKQQKEIQEISRRVFYANLPVFIFDCMKAIEEGKPMNVVMLGSPGYGKSSFVMTIAGLAMMKGFVKPEPRWKRILRSIWEHTLGVLI